MAADERDAARSVEAGQVLVGGAPASNPSRLVTAGEPLTVLAPPPRFVGRGGEKLAAALQRFDLDLHGARVLDAGASTGGFTDCALQHGAAHVHAVDVGRAQLHQRLREDARVDVRERTNVRRVAAADLGGPVDVAVADLSFTSLRPVLPALVSLVRPGADLVLLVKPQFEASRAEVDAGRGVIADPAVWRRTLLEVCGALVSHRAAIMGVMASPLRGAEGNVEFLLHARTGTTSEPDPSDAPQVDAAATRMVDAAVDEAGRRP